MGIIISIPSERDERSVVIAWEEKYGVEKCRSREKLPPNTGKLFNELMKRMPHHFYLLFFHSSLFLAHFRTSAHPAGIIEKNIMTGPCGGFVASFGHGL